MSFDVEHVVSLAGRSLLGNPPTLAFTRDVCRALIRDGVPGDFVECGVAAGVHPAVMAAVLDEQRDATRRVHLFDSFEGIPHWGPADESQPGIVSGYEPPRDGALVTTGISAQSVDQVRCNFAEWGAPIDRCVFHAGWFQHTVEPASKNLGSIAYLRLDGDLYESTRVCLEHLYPLVSPGGIVVVDDYRLAGCRRAVDEYLAARGERPHVESIEGGGGPVFWRVYPRQPRCASFADPSARCTCGSLPFRGCVRENCPARHPGDVSRLTWDEAQ